VSDRISVSSIALTILGAVIGAGFASGQEITQFFVRYGSSAGWGIVASTAGFLLLALWLTKVSVNSRAEQLSDLLRALGGRRPAGIFQHIFASFMVVGLTVMVSGSATLLSHLLGVSKLLAGLGTVALVYMVSRQQTHGLARANDLLMPCFLFLFFFYLLRSLAFSSDTAPTLVQTSYRWFWSALLYVAMNSAIMLVVIPPLVAKATSPRSAYAGVTLAICLLAALLYLIVHLISKFQTVVPLGEMPLLAVSQYMVPSLPWLYAIPLWIALATTAFANAVGLRAHLQEHQPANSEWILLLIMVSTALVSQYGFASLIALLYPLEGYACLGILAYCLIRSLLRL
jgi:uncharacterized membrane protein YkvI